MNIVKPTYDEEWIEVPMNDNRTDVLLAERKSKYKHKVTVKRNSETKYRTEEIQNWCTENFGEGGRRSAWRRGWVNDDLTLYFKDERHVTLFLLRWS